ncbi:MAG: molybdopterin-containing oxidoreductase family protein [Pseudomonadota bacterium]
MTTRTVPTFCRVCEPSCGLVAEVENDRLVRLRPDNDHPVTRGFACHKGIGFDAIHHDPDRLDVPQKRRNGKQDVAQFGAVGWDVAIPEVAAALKAVQQKYGHDAVAGYIGNPTAFNALGTQALTSFFLQLGCRRIFTSGTQDCSNKFAGSEAVFGTSTLHPVPDLEHTKYALIFGENPKVSHMSFVSMADPMEKFRKAKQNGAQVYFVNPRHIESATPATGDLLRIRPDTDLYFMAALLSEMDAAGLWREDVLREHGTHVAELREFIRPWNADSTAPVTGIAADVTRRIAREFATAESACVHMSTGVNMGRQGTLCYWLLHMLAFVTGNLDRRGGNLYSLGFYPAAKAGRINLKNVFFNSEFGELRVIRGALPGNLLADMIESQTSPVKALVVIAGNPLLSMGGGERLRKAFEKLDLLIVLDMFRNATGECADWLLPCTDMLERRDLNICGLGMQHEPFVQYTDAVVPAAAQRKEEWWILGKIEQALGLRSVFDEGETPDIFFRLNRMMSGAGLSVEKLREAPQHTVSLPPVADGRFYSDWIQTDDKRVDCCPPLFAEAMARAQAIFAELQAEPAHTLKLINLRTNYMQNSWYHNVEKLKRAKRLSNPLHMSPADAGRLGLADGDPVTVSNGNGRIEAAVLIDDTLGAGVVAMTHGWGQERSFGLNVARRYPGVNANVLLPSGPGSYEKLSNQAHMTGVPVQVARA